MSDCAELTASDYILLEFCVLVRPQFLGIIFHICCFIVRFIVSACKDPIYIGRSLFQKKKSYSFEI